MADGYPPTPLSYYKDHDRFDWYFKREDRSCKQGKAWDLFGAWGQERFMLEKADECTRAISSRLQQTHVADTCTVPTLPANVLEEESHIDHGLQPLIEQRDLQRIKESLLYRISMTKNRRRRYGDEVRSVQTSAKDLLRQVRKRLQVSQLQSLTEESTEESAPQTSRKADSQKNTNKPEVIWDLSSDISEEEDSSGELETHVGHFVNDATLSRVFCDMHKDPRLFSDIKLPVIPSEYLGGCLGSTQSTSEPDIIAYSTGPRMSNVTVKQVGRGDGFADMTLIGSKDHKERVNQVEVASYDSDLIVAARSAAKLCFYGAAGNSAELSFKDVISRPDITHSSMNPYFPEAVFVCKDSIYRWNGHSQFDQLLSHWSTRFPVEVDTRTVHFGCHPRQLIMTDPTVCSLYDTRSRSSRLDLFEVPSNTLLQVEERLVTSVQARDFTHHIIAHHTILAVDERFTKYPVLYQMLPCLTWPMLLDNVRLDTTRDLLLVGCPTNQEVFALVTENSGSILKTTPIWKCSQPSDVCYFPDTQPSIPNRLPINTRLKAGLIGLTATKLNKDSGDFAVHMLSSNGDLFEQSYYENSEETVELSDVTKSAGPVLEKLDIPQHVTDRCHTWYDQVVDDVSSASDEDEACRPAIVIPKSDVFQPHQACCLCTGRSSEGLDLSDGDQHFQCLSCGLHVNQSEQLVNKLISNQYCDFGLEEAIAPPVISSYDPAEKAGSDANSNLLIQLWNDEDITETLAERGKEWDDRREKLNTQPGDFDSRSMGFSDLDAISSLTATTRRTQSTLRSSASGISRQSRRKHGLTSLPGFCSPKHHSHSSRSIASMEENANMLSSTLPASLDILTNDSNLMAPPTSVKRRKGRNTKGF